jgi:antitoxin component YwqK of YwqJK toxin-antitoxin module/tetratricopeptide (TPR) repeat protein
MSKKLTLLPLFLSLFISTTYFAQIKSYQSAAEVYEDGIEAYSNADYDKAFEKFASINYNDTAYFDAQFKALTIASEQKQYDTVLDIANTVLASRAYNPYKAYFLNNKGRALNGMERYEEAAEVYEQALTEYPDYYLLHHNSGNNLYDMEKYDEAMQAYQTAIMYNPRYFGSHLKIALMCAEVGELTKAALAMNMVLMLESSAPNAVNYIAILEGIYEGSFETKDYKINFVEEEDFEDIDVLIENKIAQNKGYKVKCKLQFSFIKTNHLVFEKIDYIEGDNGFWNQNYVQFFKSLYKAKQFPYYSYYNCVTIEDGSIQNVIKKNLSKTKAFISWGVSELITMMNERTLRIDGKYVANNMSHYGGYGFGEVGEMKNGRHVGPYTTYNGDGIITSQGELDDMGALTGEWKFYDDKGYLTTIANFANNELEGDRTTYFENGSRRVAMTVKDNKIVGKKQEFYLCDQLYSEVEYNDQGIEEGPGSYYYAIGVKSHDMNLKDGYLDGEYKQYYDNGQLYVNATYSDGKIVGAYESFYYSGKPYSKGNYEDGNQVGKWTYLHENGELIEEGEFKDGYRIGVWKEFNDEGKIIEEVDYGETGKKTGIYRQFDNDGNLILELTYKGSDIIAYKNFDKDGNVLSEGEKKKKSMDFIMYHTKDVPKLRGAYYKGNEYGLWERFNEYGVLVEEYSYNEDGYLEGEYKEFFDNGELEVISTYKDGYMDGPFTEYYKNGKVYSEGWYVEGEPVGEWVGYHRDGTVRTRRYFTEGELNGELIFYDESGKVTEISKYFYGNYEGGYNFDTTGNIIYEIMLDKGAGEAKWLDFQGNVMTHHFYKGGVQHGKCEYYYGNGQISSEGEKFNGKEVGEWKYYFRDGSVSGHGSYVDGDDEGVWTWYYEGGQKSSETEYHNGERHGFRKFYYQNGEMESWSNYKYGLRHGEQKYYDELGQLQLVRYYHFGTFLGYAYPGSNGELVEMIPYTKNLEIKSYFKNGKVSHESTFKDGFYQGTSKYYHSNGKVAEEKEYVNGSLNGDYKEYYASGKIKKHYEYLDGDFHGENKKYYENGKLKSLERYKLDSKWGWAEYYNEDGSLKEKVYYYEGREYKK